MFTPTTSLTTSVNSPRGFPQVCVKVIFGCSLSPHLTQCMKSHVTARELLDEGTHVPLKQRGTLYTSSVSAYILSNQLLTTHTHASTHTHLIKLSTRFPVTSRDSKAVSIRCYIWHFSNPFICFWDGDKEIYFILQLKPRKS